MIIRIEKTQSGKYRARLMHPRLFGGIRPSNFYMVLRGSLVGAFMDLRSDCEDLLTTEVEMIYNIIADKITAEVVSIVEVNDD